MSTPIADLPLFNATFIVVPLPANGSSTIPSSGHPISKQRETNSSGYGAVSISVPDDAEVELFRKVYTEGKEAGEFDIDNVDLVADITHYCIKGLEVPYIYGRIAHGMTEEATKPQVAKFVYGALGNFKKNSDR